MEFLGGAHRSEKQLIHMLSNRAMDPKELSMDPNQDVHVWWSK